MILFVVYKDFTKIQFIKIVEDVLKETDVVRVLATSKGSGINADITYSIVAGNEARKFYIHPKNGMIQVASEGNGHLDHETAKSYFLTIQAQDGGDPPLSNHATVNITVLDVNDNRPMFSQVSYNAMINEAATENEQVGMNKLFRAMFIFVHLFTETRLKDPKYFRRSKRL